MFGDHPDRHHNATGWFVCSSKGLGSAKEVRVKIRGNLTEWNDHVRVARYFLSHGNIRIK